MCFRHPQVATQFADLSRSGRSFQVLIRGLPQHQIYCLAFFPPVRTFKVTFCVTSQSEGLMQGTLIEARKKAPRARRESPPHPAAPSCLGFDLRKSLHVIAIRGWVFRQIRPYLRVATPLPDFSPRMLRVVIY